MPQRKKRALSFELDELVEIYIRKLAPSVYSRKHKQNAPAYEVYFDVMKILTTAIEGSEEVNEMLREYRKSVIGDSCLKSAPAEYWEMRFITELQWKPSEWRKMPVIDKAMLMASHYLNNMIQTIDRHYERQDEEKKKNDKKGKKDG